MIYETFSKRRKRLEKAGQTDVYQYEELPAPFRMQVVYIWESAIGHYSVGGAFSSYRDESSSTQFWDFIYKTITREAGLPGSVRVAKR
jgi:hypothetical protein